MNTAKRLSGQFSSESLIPLLPYAGGGEGSSCQRIPVLPPLDDFSQQSFSSLASQHVEACRRPTVEGLQRFNTRRASDRGWLPLEVKRTVLGGRPGGIALVSVLQRGFRILRNGLWELGLYSWVDVWEVPATATLADLQRKVDGKTIDDMGPAPVFAAVSHHPFSSVAEIQPRSSRGPPDGRLSGDYSSYASKNPNTSPNIDVRPEHEQPSNRRAGR